MKVIVTGCTGLVGGALLRECIGNPRITHAFALTRKALPTDVADNEKITVIQHEDFASYPPELLQKLAGAEACLWAIGGTVRQLGGDAEYCRKVNVDFTLAAAKAFVNGELAGSQNKFRFVFCSGKFAEWDQDKWLPFLGDTRRIKGLVEKGLVDLAKEHPQELETWCVRPGDIFPPDANILRRNATALTSGIENLKLAAAMSKIALDGHQNQIVGMDELPSLAER
ncbi:hypothetical protein MCOR29_009408 [Pyricularia oryzae]|nr:hypothetical protein MCOR19_000768 [Pyricularia oryzae]KAI6308143.1 hypothetical protein MCOR29_009408 [Pyricularia oryzae]KAI6430842.1 hypothetical protein MCOR22_010091 [Pyricularia oryzae]KAI6450830.1 hypothetical protein MCOR17_009826 [Pyricularia oryzae]KAI6453624.1 hypothetical protein MCOR15_008560 [Pyricularia oryzae]